MNPETMEPEMVIARAPSGLERETVEDLAKWLHWQGINLWDEAQKVASHKSYGVAEILWTRGNLMMALAEVIVDGPDAHLYFPENQEALRVQEAKEALEAHKELVDSLA